MLIAVPSENFPIEKTSKGLAERLLALARLIKPKQIAKSPRGPKVAKPKEWLEGQDFLLTFEAFVKSEPP